MSRNTSCRVVGVLAVAMVVVASAWAGSEEDQARQWYNTHTSREGPISKLGRIRIAIAEEPGVACVGLTHEYVGKAWHVPYSSSDRDLLRVRLIWMVDPASAGSVLENPVRDLEIQPGDSIKVAARVVPHGENHFVRLVAFTEDPERINRRSGDHWFFAGMGEVELVTNPNDMRQLVPSDVAFRIRKGMHEDLLRSLGERPAGRCSEVPPNRWTESRDG